MSVCSKPLVLAPGRKMGGAAWSLCIVAVLMTLKVAWCVQEVDSLPGWKGERFIDIEDMKSKVTDLSSYDPSRPRYIRNSHRAVPAVPAKPAAVNRVVQVSWKPRAFLYKGFLSEVECDYVVKIARDKMARSTVADNDSGKSVLSEIRTSSGMFVDKYKDPVIKEIEERVARWTFLPVENQEAMQVLKYEHGQRYDAHFDDYHDKANQMPGGHRYATVLMYLSNVVRGGETVFPSAEDKETDKSDDTWSDCGRKGIAVKPTKGDALLFFSLQPDASPDFYSLHSGCPVLEGEKWSATKWIHTDPFDPPPRDPSVCADEDPRCADWAAAGECTRNPHYMVEGPSGELGSCRKSCRACKPKPPAS